jgi:hypothetical protein
MTRARGPTAVATTVSGRIMQGFKGPAPDKPSYLDLLLVLSGTRRAIEFGPAQLGTFLVWEEIIRHRLLGAAEHAPFTLAAKHTNRHGGMDMTDWWQANRAEMLAAQAWEWLAPCMPKQPPGASCLAWCEDILAAFDQAIKTLELLE